MKTLRWSLSFAIPLLIGIGIIYAFAFSSGQDPQAEDQEKPKEEILTNNKEKSFQTDYNVFAFDLPEKLDFAGEQVPLYDQEVRERLERELLVNTYWQSHTLLLIKRSNRWFPIIEKVLEKNGIPEDFKYLPIAESNLQNLVSPAGAVGYWQFLKSTAKEKGLEVRKQVDERYDIRKSTEAACEYLKKAYEEFGNWTLAAASYNLGIYGIKRVLRQQEAKSYYDLHLNPETSRYIFRILAIKEILENPHHYGFNFEEEDLYQPYKTEIVKVSTSVPSWVDFAQKHNITYKTLKVYNPWIQRKTLTNTQGTTYKVEIPKEAAEHQGKGMLFREDTLAHMPSDKALAIHGQEVREEFKDHEVKEGQTIEKIAKIYQVRVPQIMEWNHMNTSYVKRGQTLKILKRAIEQ